MKTKPMYMLCNFAGLVILLVTLICEWSGAINDNTVPSIFDSYDIPILIPLFAYIFCMVVLLIWVIVFTFDGLRGKYENEENRALDDIGIKMFMIELCYSISVICFGWELYITASIMIGLAIPFTYTAFFIFSYHIDGRSRIEKFIWSPLIGIFLIWCQYLFVAFMSVAIASHGSTTSASSGWSYAWLSIITFFALITYSVMSPSFVATAINTMILAGIAAENYEANRGFAVFTIILACAPVSMLFISYVFSKCCK